MGKKNLRWKEIVLEWRKSGKNISTWAKEHGISQHSLSKWQLKLKRSEKAEDQTQKFIELKDHLEEESQIILEIKGVKIHLKSQFNKATLRECLLLLKNELI